MENPYMTARNENRNAAQGRTMGGPSGKRNRKNNGNTGGGGGGGNGGASDTDKNKGKTSQNEADTWAKTNPQEYFMSLLDNADYNLNPTGDSRFTDWYGNQYYNQLHNAYLGAINSPGADAKLKWTDYVASQFANNGAQNAWKDYFGDAFRNEAITNSLAGNGLGMVNESRNPFGDWLKNTMATQLQADWEQNKATSGLTFNDYLEQQAASGAYSNYYDQYMRDPNRWNQSFNMGRWQAF